MSSYLSDEYRINQPPQLGDLNVARSVMGSLQGKYDANKAEIEKTLALYNANLKGLRDSDNQYIASKIKQVESAIDMYSKKNGNLSRSMNKDTIMSAITGIMDDEIVQDAVTSVQHDTNLTKQYQEALKKDPKTASTQNLAYSRYKGGYDDYMAGRTSKLGAMQYIPYTDIEKEDVEFLTKIKSLKGKRTIETPKRDANGNRTLEIEEKSIDGLTNEEIREYFQDRMSPQHQQQLTINGWAKYKDYPTQARETLVQLQKDRVTEIDRVIKEKEALQKSSGITPTQKDNLQAEIDGFKVKRASHVKAQDQVKDAPIDLVGGELEKSTYLSGISNLASTEWSTTSKVDPIFKAQKDMEYREEEMEIKRQELAIKQRKEKADNAKIDPLTGMPKAIIQESTRETPIASGFDAVTNLTDQYHQGISSFRSALQTEIEPEDKDAFNSLLRLEGINPNTLTWEAGKERPGGKTIYNTIKDTFIKAGLQHSYPELADKIVKKASDLAGIAKVKVGIEKEAYPETYNQDPDKYINFLKRAESELAPKFSIISDVVGRKDNEKLKKEIQAFVSKAGGWGNMKTYLQDNPDDVGTFAILTDKADNAYKGLDPHIKSLFTGGGSRVIDHSLVADSKKALDAAYNRQTNSGGTAKVAIDKTFTVSGEEAVGYIVNSLDIDKFRNNPSGEMFDNKSAITVYRNGSEIIIAQAKGKDKDNPNAIKEARVSVLPGDAAYNIITRQIAMSEDEVRTSYDFNSRQTSFSASQPRVEDLNVSSTDSATLQRRGNTLMDKTIAGGAQGLFRNSPIQYMTSESIQEIYVKELVQAGYDPQESEQFSKKFTENIASIKLEGIREIQDVQGGRAPQLTFKVSGGGLNSTFSLPTGAVDVSKEIKYIHDFYPQTIISDIVLKNILANKKPLSTYVR